MGFLRRKLRERFQPEENEDRDIADPAFKADVRMISGKSVMTYFILRYLVLAEATTDFDSTLQRLRGRSNLCGCLERPNFQAS